MENTGDGAHGAAGGEGAESWSIVHGVDIGEDMSHDELMKICQSEVKDMQVSTVSNFFSFGFIFCTGFVLQLSCSFLCRCKCVAKWVPCNMLSLNSSLETWRPRSLKSCRTMKRFAFSQMQS